ncbi:MAG: hypothetical protein ACYSSL_08200 [Planctomycetota bacterium]|jgi:hypothetical protein
MKTKIVKITALAIIMCFSTSAAATSVGLTGVDVVPEQPLETDIITFDISGGASQSSSWVEYDEFFQNGTSLQLDLYVSMGQLDMISYWTHSREILPLPAETYTLEVRAFRYQSTILEDTYTVDFTVVPEPASFVLFAIGLPIVRSLSRRKG